MSSSLPPASTPARGACLACRAKKAKCVPGPRRCERCTEMGIDDCVYEKVKKRGIGKTLRMGEACACCRVKKRKCDAKRPCTTCIVARTTSECVYDNEKHLQPAGTYPSHWPDGHLSGQQPRGPDLVQIPTATPYHSLTDGMFGDVPPPAKLDQIPSTSSDATRVATNESAVLRVFRDSHVPHGELILARRNPLEQCVLLDTSLTFLAVPFFFLSTIPHEPWISLSFLGKEKLQVQISETAATDLAMKARLWYLLNLPKLGIRFGRKKLDALLCGDKSGTVIHRSFVWGAEALGIAAFMDATPAMVQFHARQVRAAWEALDDLHKGNDYRAKVHSASSVAPGFIYTHMPQTALLYTQKCFEFAQAGDVQFVPAYGRPPEFSEDIHETSVALSQAIYWANYLFLMRGGPEPHAAAKLEKEFRQELPQAYPVLFEICPLTMRTKGILLVKDTILLLRVVPADDVEFVLWRQSCDRTSASLEVFSLDLLANMKKFRELGDKGGADVISSSCIACLAHLAIFYEAVCRTDPVGRSELCNLCDSALQRLGTLTSELHFDEYTHLDLLLGDSWNKSLPLFDARIASLPSEESTSLWYCRRVVAEAYSDFRARVPDYEPPIILSLALALATSGDVTTEDSNYLTSIAPEAGMQYGI